MTSLLVRLLLALLATCLLAACEAKSWDKDKDMNVMHLGAFKLDLQLEFPDPTHRAIVLSALDGRLNFLNAQEVQSLIDKPGVKYHVTPLMLAVWARHIHSARWLLKHGANPNYRAPKGVGYRNPLENDSPLHYAVNRADLKLATLLFDFGADANLFGVLYPVFFETMDRGRGDGPLFRLFIDRGADINLRARPHGRTVLMHAATRGHCEAALHLIELGADVHARTRVRLGGQFRINNPVEDDWMYINILAAAFNGIDLDEKRNEGRCYARLKRKLIERGITFPQFDARVINTWLRDKTPIAEPLLREHGADDDTVRRILKWYEEEYLPPPQYR